MAIDQELAARFNAKWAKDENSECWLWTASLMPNGYGQIKRPGERKQYYAHRLSYEIHKGPVPKRTQVCHTCDVRRCVNPDHLFLGSSADNQLDMVKKGRATYGERNAQAKLTSAQVQDIRTMASATNLSQSKIGAAFGVTQTTVGRILRGIRWRKDVTSPAPYVETKPRMKLTDADVEQIRIIGSTGVPQTRIATMFDVSQGQVSRILRGAQRQSAPKPPS